MCELESTYDRPEKAEKTRKPRANLCERVRVRFEQANQFATCKSREPISPDTSFDIIHTAKRLLYKLDNNYMP